MSNIQPRQSIIKQIEQEYNQKVADIESNIKSFKQAIIDIQSNSCVQDSYGGLVAPITKNIHYQGVLKSLKTSAWQLAFKRCGIDRLATESEKKIFNQSMSNPPDFSLENCLNTFENYISNPRASILKSFVEVFTNLDQAYKSHEKVKIGVSKLPKRIILSSANDTYGWGFNRLQSVLNALAILEDKPLLDYDEIKRLQDTGRCENENEKDPAKKINRGVHLKLFNNGNGHLYFDKEQLLNINRALAEYYGDVLPDCPEENVKKKESTAVSKDLQFYKTPKELVEYILTNCVKYNSFQKDSVILEPSCGDGAIMDVLKNKGFNDIDGIEYEFNRANIAKSKGHNVFIGNFLETEPVAKYNIVFMNPPFYGKHYIKHVEHAKKFLKTGGRLYSILPITARDDHKILKGDWNDLPTRSFSESGTNINTVLYQWTNM